MKRFWRVLGIGVTVIVVTLTVLIIWPARYPPKPDPETTRIIHNVRVVDVIEGTASEPQSILIRDGKISQIGSVGSGRALPSLDAGGAYAVPAFWDMHVHTFQSSPQMHFPLWVANGVLNIRDMMDCPMESDTLVACASDKRRWNSQVAAGTLAGPRIVETASFYLAKSDMTRVEAERRVEQARLRKIDAIKVYDPLPVEAFRAAARQSDASGMKLVGHLPRSVSLEYALAAGQDSFEHAHVLPRHCFAQAEAWRSGALKNVPPTRLLAMIVEQYDPDRCASAFAAIKDAGAWLVPTHVTREEDARAADPDFIDDERLVYLDPLSRWARNDDLSAVSSQFSSEGGRDALDRYFRHGLSLTGKAHEAGVDILVGMDTTLGGLRYHDELAHLVAAGLAPADVLRAATFDAARYAGQDATTGSLAVGKTADLVLLEGNPLEDISQTRHIIAVVSHGRLYDRSLLDELANFVRNQANAPHNWAKLLWGFARSSMASEM